MRHKRPEEQNTLKWNVRKLGERKCRKEFERKFTQKFMASRYSQGGLSEKRHEKNGEG